MCICLVDIAACYDVMYMCIYLPLRWCEGCEPYLQNSLWESLRAIWSSPGSVAKRMKSGAASCVGLMMEGCSFGSRWPCNVMSLICGGGVLGYVKPFCDFFHGIGCFLWSDVFSFCVCALVNLVVMPLVVIKGQCNCTIRLGMLSWLCWTMPPPYAEGHTVEPHFASWGFLSYHDNLGCRKRPRKDFNCCAARMCMQARRYCAAGGNESCNKRRMHVCYEPRCLARAIPRYSPPSVDHFSIRKRLQVEKVCMFCDCCAAGTDPLLKPDPDLILPLEVRAIVDKWLLQRYRFAGSGAREHDTSSFH